MGQFFDDITMGLNQAIEVEQDKLKAKKAVFAYYMGVSKKTVEAWERGTNSPSGSACRLLDILDSTVPSLLGYLPFVKSNDQEV